MLTSLMVLLSFGADPPSSEVLKTFRDEFVAITPGQKDFPAALKVGDKELKPAGPFFLAKYEVPQNLWEAVMDRNPSRWKGKRNSAELFTYDDAQEFCLLATELMRARKLIEANEVVRL